MVHKEFGFFLLCLSFVMLPGKKSAKNSEEGQLKVWNFNTFVIGSHVAYLSIFLIFPEGSLFILLLYRPQQSSTPSGLHIAYKSPPQLPSF